MGKEQNHTKWEDIEERFGIPNWTTEVTVTWEKVKDALGKLTIGEDDKSWVEMEKLYELIYFNLSNKRGSVDKETFATYVSIVLMRSSQHFKTLPERPAVARVSGASLRLLYDPKETLPKLGLLNPVSARLISGRLSAREVDYNALREPGIGITRKAVQDSELHLSQAIFNRFRK